MKNAGGVQLRASARHENFFSVNAKEKQDGSFLYVVIVLHLDQCTWGESIRSATLDGFTLWAQFCASVFPLRHETYVLITCPQSFKCLGRSQGHDGYINHFALIGHSVTYCAWSCSNDKTIRMWNFEVSVNFWHGNDNTGAGALA